MLVALSQGIKVSSISYVYMKFIALAQGIKLFLYKAVVLAQGASIT